MPTTLIFMRHGESSGNKSSSFNGNLDLDLTQLGENQAECTAQYLDKYKIDIIYSSDLKRAFKTALHTAKRQNIEIIKSKNLREIFGGDFEGLKYDKIEQMFPKEYNLWRNDMGNCVCPNGESIRDLEKRVNREVKNIAMRNKDKTVLISTHATPIRVMSTVWYKKDITNIRDFDWVKNASVTVVNYDDIENPKVIEYDVHNHLTDLLTHLPSTI